MDIPSLPCACATLRRADRALTSRYEAALRSHGLSATQFTILQVLSLSGDLRQGDLADALAMDSTSLSRTLPRMVKSKWLAVRPMGDRRQKVIGLTGTGRAKFRAACGPWRQVQQQIHSELGDTDWQQLFTVADKITRKTIEVSN